MIIDFEFTDTLVAISCYKCGVAFGITESMRNQRMSDRQNFYCPNGHGQHYLKSTESRLREQLEAARSLAARERERRETVERSRNAIKGQVTRIKRRVANGVCPCCNRSFADLARHMSGQHPDYVEST